MEWISADHHLFDAKIAEFRGFSSVEEMNEEIISRHNSLVSEDDLTYIVGDFSLGSRGDTLDAMRRMNGRKILIKGNHDWRGQDFWRKVCERVVTKLTVRGVLLKHRIRKHRKRDTPCIHGHNHDEVSEYPHFNVCMDHTNLYPIPFEEALKHVHADYRPSNLTF